MAGSQPLQELRKRMLHQAAQTRLPQQDQARAAQTALTGGAGASPGSIQALQRSVGNRTTTGVLQRALGSSSLQVEEGVEKSTSMVDTGFGNVGTWSTFGGLTKDDSGKFAYLNSDPDQTNTAAGQMAGTVSAFGGSGTGLYGLVTKTKGAIEAQKTKSEEEAAGRSGQAKHRDASRGHGSSSLDAIQSAGSMTSSTISGAGGVVGSTTGALLGGIAGVIALPIQLISVIRTSRKMAKQWKRVNALAAGWNDPNRSDKKIVADFEKLNDLVTAQQQLVTDAESDLNETKLKLQKSQQAKATAKGISSDDVMAEEQLKQQVDAQTATVEQLKQKLETLKNDVTAAQQAKNDAAQRIADRQKRQEDEKEDPDDIRAYALRKNQDGRFKKIVNIVGGLLGIGGGISAFVASFAAAAVVSAGIAATATPVGWALCGAAALIGLAMGGYALVKWAKKRYGAINAEKEKTKGAPLTRGEKAKSFFSSLNPFRKVGGGERERMAKRLYMYATGQITDAKADDKRKAEETLTALGLDPAELKFDQNKSDAEQEKAAIKLIMEKMAS